MEQSLINNRISIFIQDEELQLEECCKQVKSLKCGAINIFLGTIRDNDFDSNNSNTKKPIDGIHFEIYPEMARRQVLAIMSEVLAGKDQNSKACVSIRTGDVPIGEVSIIICVSSTSRKLSHVATMQILDSIKSRVAIWKKIIFSDGTKCWDSQIKSEAQWLNGDK